MSCSCIANNNFDFVIEYKSDHLLFIDKSDWVTPEYNTPLTTHSITIINESRSQVYQIRVGGTTKIKYCDLPTNSTCGPDGIYTFRVESCGEIFSRCEAIIQHIICSYSKLLVTLPIDQYDQKIFPIFREIELIKANARICDTENTIKHYNLIREMLSQLSCKC